jgi:hypothetical protein
LGRRCCGLGHGAVEGWWIVRALRKRQQPSGHDLWSAQFRLKAPPLGPGAAVSSIKKLPQSVWDSGGENWIRTDRGDVGSHGIRGADVHIAAAPPTTSRISWVIAA